MGPGSVGMRTLTPEGRRHAVHAAQECAACRHFAWTFEMHPIQVTVPDLRGVRGWHHPACPNLRTAR